MPWHPWGEGEAYHYGKMVGIVLFYCVLKMISRLGQSAVHLAACAITLWSCAAHGPPLAAHQCMTPLAGKEEGSWQEAQAEIKPVAS